MQENVKCDLKLDFATHKAAKYACENWHYSRRLPTFKLLKIGVWENKKFVGVVIFGVGASAVLHKQFNLQRTEVCELVRVALSKHITPVSRIISIALKILKKHNTKIKVVVSFADTNENHHGGIYQAGNWIYTGKSNTVREYFYNGKYRHVTDIYKRLKKSKIKTLKVRNKPPKHRYVIALCKSMAKILEKRRQPYPKRAQNIDSDVASFQEEQGGASPTCALQPS